MLRPYGFVAGNTTEKGGSQADFMHAAIGSSVGGRCCFEKSGLVLRELREVCVDFCYLLKPGSGASLRIDVSEETYLSFTTPA